MHHEQNNVQNKEHDTQLDYKSINGPDNQPVKASLWQVFCSILAALFGVQSSTHAARDFTQKSPVAYVIIGLVAVIVFVLLLVLVVQQVMRT